MGSRFGNRTKNEESEMKTLVDGLILMAAVTFIVGVFLKLLDTSLMGMLPVNYWRFAIGCLAFAIALSVREPSKKK